jgi:hypothetical protein
MGSQASVASDVAQHGAASKTSIAALPPEILEHICNLLHDEPGDLASCHLVDSRYEAAPLCTSASMQHAVRCKLLISVLLSCIC